MDFEGGIIVFAGVIGVGIIAGGIMGLEHPTQEPEPVEIVAVHDEALISEMDGMNSLEMAHLIKQQAEQLQAEVDMMREQVKTAKTIIRNDAKLPHDMATFIENVNSDNLCGSHVKDPLYDIYQELKEARGLICAYSANRDGTIGVKTIDPEALSVEADI